MASGRTGSHRPETKRKGRRRILSVLSCVLLALGVFLSLSACGSSRKESYVVDVNQIISYDSFEAFEAAERAEPDGLSAYYVPPVSDDALRLDGISQRRGTYVSFHYLRTAGKEVPSDLPDLEREQLQSLTLTEYLYYSDARGLAQFISNGFQETVIGGRTFYLGQAYSVGSSDESTERQRMLTGYEIAFEFDGRLFYMHLPPDDELENLVRYLDLIKKEIRKIPGTDGTQSEPDETESYSVRSDNYGNDEKRITELLTKTYSLEELESFFQQYFCMRDYIPDNTNKPTLMFLELDEMFPVEMLRTSQYSAYRVKEGGYYYVFWSVPYWLKERPQRGEGEPLYKILAVENTCYLPVRDRKLDFSSAKWGKGTAEDVQRIDPYFDIDLTLSSGPITYSYLNSKEILKIRYFEPKQDLVSYSQLIIRETRKLDRQDPQTGTWFSLILEEDLPADQEESNIAD